MGFSSSGKPAAITKSERNAMRRAGLLSCTHPGSNIENQGLVTTSHLRHFGTVLGSKKTNALYENCAIILALWLF
jgi:hypothetical protein